MAECGAVAGDGRRPSWLRAQAVRRPGLLVHRRPSLSASEIRLLDNLLVTSPIQTLIDLATELGRVATERAVNDADKRDLIDPEALRLALNDHGGEPGVRRLREILNRLTFRLSDSDLEINFRPIAALPSPLSKQRVNGYEVDFFWPDLGLVIETDGLRYHRIRLGNRCIPDVSPFFRRAPAPAA